MSDPVNWRLGQSEKEEKKNASVVVVVTAQIDLKHNKKVFF